MRSFICLILGLFLIYLSGCATVEHQKTSVADANLSQQTRTLEKNGIKGKNTLTLPKEDPNKHAKEVLKDGPVTFEYIGDSGFYKDANQENCYNAFFELAGSVATIEKEKADWKKGQEAQVKKAQESRQLPTPLTEEQKKLFEDDRIRQEGIIIAKYRKNSNRIKLCFGNKPEDNKVFIQVACKHILGRNTVVTRDKKNNLVQFKITGRWGTQKVDYTKIIPAWQHKPNFHGNFMAEKEWEDQQRTIVFFVDSEIEILAKISDEVRKTPDVNLQPKDSNGYGKGGDGWGEWNGIDAYVWNEAGY